MIPLYLRISGFLSYRDPVELDFTGFDLACISGPNGAGKSTLLDAITWSLFGQARRRDDSLINLQSGAAEVTFAFRYEDADYRVVRSLRRGKPTILEFQARPVPDGPPKPAMGAGLPWNPLTERTLRETQARIQQVLRLDYETFVNASFFLQGKADLFAQQTPARRKEMLGNILGMEIWDVYRARTAESRHLRDAELAALDGRLGEIAVELEEEGQRKQRLSGLESELSRLVASRGMQATALESTRKAHAVLEQQRILLAQQMAALERAEVVLKALRDRLEDRQAARLEDQDLIGRAAEIEAAYASWLATISKLETLEGVAKAFHEHERRRTPLLQAIASEQARLTQEETQLTARQQLLAEKTATSATVEAELQRISEVLAGAEAKVQQRDTLQAQLASIRESVAHKTAENAALKDKMDDLKRRLDALDAAVGAACPLCGQPLSDAHRRSTLQKLQSDGKGLGDQYRLNVTAIQDLRLAVADSEKLLESLGRPDEQRVSLSRAVAQLTERLASLRSELQDWERVDRPRLEYIMRLVAAGDFATDARAQLTGIDTQLAALGYDAAAHDALRLAEAQQRPAEQLHARLQSARAALGTLDNEIRNLESQIKERALDASQQETQVRAAQADLDSLAAGLPDLAQAERSLFELQQQENQLHQEVGAARQKVAVLHELRQRRGDLELTRQTLASIIGRHKILENAFGKDGVPALLIEQALPEIESRANEILDRLSDGQMSVHFETQAAYRDRKREDLKETLEIKISDGAGKRDYEMYSGGEAFRANFAIRLALSQVLAGRKGARLQMLVIDEAFGSQDIQGRQRLIETINRVRHDFAKILLISHLDELKDAFPTRIEVSKTGHGSTLQVF